MAKVTMDLSKGFFEAEGSEEFVDSQIHKFQESILPAVQRLKPAEIATENSSYTATIPPATDTIDVLPSINIKEIAIKQLAKTDAEWILLYTKAAQPNEQGTCTYDNIFEQYKSSDRVTPSRTNHFGREVKKAVKKNWLTPLGTNKYAITADGNIKIKQILNTKESTKRTPSKKLKVGGNKSTENYAINSELNMFPEGKVSLKDFFLSKLPKNPTVKESIVVFVYYLEKTAEKQNITIDDIFTCFREVKDYIHIPTALRQNIQNISRDPGWINKKDIKNIKATTLGIRYVEQQLPKAQQ